MDKKTEKQLIEAAQQGQRSAAEELFEFYIHRVHNYLYQQLGNTQDAEDATQETLMEALRSLDNYQDQGNFKAWLFCIAYRQAQRSWRKKRIRCFLSGWKELPTDQVVDQKLSPIEHSILQEERAQLIQGLKLLSDKERTVVLLRMSEDLSFKEIASIMNSPLNTTLSRMHCSVKKLKKFLKEENSGSGETQ